MTACAVEKAHSLDVLTLHWPSVKLAVTRKAHASGSHAYFTSGLFSPPLSKKVVYFENHHLSSVWSALSVRAEFSVQPLERSSAASTNHDLCANAQFVFYSPPVGNVLLFLFLQYSVWASLCSLMYKCRVWHSEAVLTFIAQCVNILCVHLKSDFNKLACKHTLWCHK